MVSYVKVHKVAYTSRVGTCELCVGTYSVFVSVIMCILVWTHVCAAPPMVMGAWPMVGTLWRLSEY